MVEREVKMGKENGPLGLSLVEFLGSPEVLQIFVVSPNLRRVLCTFKEVLPLLYCLNDCQHLLVIDIVVLLDCSAWYL